MKFCKDCTYMHIPDTGINFARCALTGGKKLDLVTGEIAPIEMTYCTVERMEGENKCGPLATRFSCKACADNEGQYCSEECFEEAAAEHAWMAGVPLSAVTGKLSEEEEQDMRDAGRGHLV